MRSLLNITTGKHVNIHQTFLLMHKKDKESRYKKKIELESGAKKDEKFSA